MSKVWLITGSGNGLGRDIAEAALAAGDSVVAGARRTEELAPLVAQYGERVKPVTLEVRDEVAAKAAVQLAVDTFGRLDVLVNNASDAQAEERSHLSGIFGRWSPRGLRAIRRITRPSGLWAVSATHWRWKLRRSGSRSAHWSREVFEPTGQGAPVRMRRTCCRTTRPRSVRCSRCCVALKGVRKAIRGRSRM